MSWPSREATVATTSWIPDLASRSASFCLDHAARVGRNDIRLIDDATRERRKSEGEGGNDRAQQCHKKDGKTRTSFREG